MLRFENKTPVLQGHVTREDNIQIIFAYHLFRFLIG